MDELYSPVNLSTDMIVGLVCENCSVFVFELEEEKQISPCRSRIIPLQRVIIFKVEFALFSDRRLFTTEDGARDTHGVV